METTNEWDLDQIFPNYNKNTVESEYLEIIQKIQDLSKVTNDQIVDLISNTKKMNKVQVSIILLKIIKKWDILLAKSYDFVNEMHLMYDHNSIPPDRLAGLEYGMKLKNQIDIGWNETLSLIIQYIQKQPEILNKELFGDYTFLLNKQLKLAQFKLTIEEEKLAIEKDEIGKNFLLVLRQKYLNRLKISINSQAIEKTYSFGDLMQLQKNPSQKIRSVVFSQLNRHILRNKQIFTYALRSIIEDTVNLNQKRGYESHLHPTAIANDISEPIIFNMMEEIYKNAKFYRKFLSLKAKLNGNQKLHYCDILSPINPPFSLKTSKFGSFTWEKAKKTVIDAYSWADQDFGEIVKKMFQEKRVDASIRKGKAGMNYSRPRFADNNSFVLINFKGSLFDVFMLMHELGHSIQVHYASQNGYILGTESLLFNESVAKFGEIILAKFLLEQYDNLIDRLIILNQILEFNGYSIHFGAVRFLFEYNLHDLVKSNQNLTFSMINKVYINAYNKIYRNSLKNLEKLQYEWTWTPHYYVTEFRFYNYSYIFAVNFAYRLYNSMQENQEKTIITFKNLIKAGSKEDIVSKSQKLGFNLHKKSFWTESMSVFKNFVEDFEDLVNTLLENPPKSQILYEKDGK